MRYPEAVMLAMALGSAAYLLLAIPEVFAVGTDVTGIQWSKNLGAFTLVCSFISYLAVLQGVRRDILPRRCLILGNIGLFIMAWMAFGLWLNGLPFNKIVLEIYQSGVPGFLIALLLHKYRFARNLFVLVILTQMVLFMLLSYGVPGPWDAFEEVPRDTTTFKRGAVEELQQGRVAKYSGQFGNSVQGGFYGSIGLALGICLSINKSVNSRLIGYALLVFGLMVSFIAVQRALWIGIVCGILFAFRSKVVSRRMLVGVVGVLFLLLEINAIQYVLKSEFYNHFAPDTMISAGSGRLDVISASWKMINNDPLIGSGSVSKVIQRIGTVPHHISVFWSVLYGLPVGLAVSFLLLIGVIAYSKSQQAASTCGIHGNPISPRFSTIVGWTFLLLMFTNGTATFMFYWICCCIACMPWAYAAEINRERVPISWKASTLGTRLRMPLARSNAVSHNRHVREAT